VFKLRGRLGHRRERTLALLAEEGESSALGLSGGERHALELPGRGIEHEPGAALVGRRPGRGCDRGSDRGRGWPVHVLGELGGSEVGGNAAELSWLEVRGNGSRRPWSGSRSLSRPRSRSLSRPGSGRSSRPWRGGCSYGRRGLAAGEVVENSAEFRLEVKGVG